MATSENVNAAAALAAPTAGGGGDFGAAGNPAVAAAPVPAVPAAPAPAPAPAPVAAAGGGGDAAEAAAAADTNLTGKWLVFLVILLISSIVWFSIVMGLYMDKKRLWLEEQASAMYIILILVLTPVLCFLIRLFMRYLNKRPKKLQFAVIVTIYGLHAWLAYFCVRKEERDFEYLALGSITFVLTLRLSDTHDNPHTMLKATVVQFLGVAIETVMSSELKDHREKAAWMAAVALVGFLSANVPKANESFVEDLIVGFVPCLDGVINA